MPFIESKYKDIFPRMYDGTVRKQGIPLDVNCFAKDIKVFNSIAVSNLLGGKWRINLKQTDEQINK